ncbi:hypothetical protein WH221_16875 [Chryseobacterium culicis]|uniref:Protein CR006 P-loop domain-containing protein n=1 Tax=Chryseobacterium culicis TaxID=680127 RepID=A0A2S9CPC9_CHRCI|nr:hypothetical protein [Chryseobacterium culicis]PRB82360.1 hypothetical protein CQ022_16835 [Chryseobacterium culicis]PRB88735.1 hypothetical protein CQ033_15730 [Chryseobacterium culicis]
MNILSIELENCFGIGKLNQNFNFEESNSLIIYAPNGTMKTSFAKTLDLVSKGDNKDIPKDYVYNRKSKYKILCDGKPINPNSILVINAEDSTFDAADKITSFIASTELKDKYDSLYKEINNAKGDLLKKLKQISKSNDCEGEYVGSFRENTNDTFLDILIKNNSELSDNNKAITFKYNDVFDTKGNVKKFLDKNEAILEDYINNYNDIISNSRLFKINSDNSFGTYQANEIIKSIEDNAYFEAGHIFILEDGTEIKNFQELKTLYEQEIEKIFADEKLKKSFDKVDKAIGANGELRAFKKVIEDDNSLLVELKDYNEFKKKVWNSYLSEIKEDVNDLTNLYENKKKELEDIIKDANEEKSRWIEIIKKFNERFYVPFTVGIKNQQDVILKQETANLEFIYKDSNDTPVKQTKENILKILSKGEQRAYFILQFLFEIESRMLIDNTTILIFDDIADSFDYKNKYAIIEYISDLHLLSKFKLLILTHNFDFYRTLALRLELPEQSLFMAIKDENRLVELKHGLYAKGVFKEYLKKCHDSKIFISLIAFVRNLIEYSESSKVDDCQLLLSCLHHRENSKDITVGNVFNIFKNRISKLKDVNINFDVDLNIQDFIFAVADSIVAEQNVNEILLENKITLALASRLKTEQYLLSKLTGIDMKKIQFNQTKALSKEYKKKYNGSINSSIVDRVNLMTPENIHINSFMYEPLIDMSVFHLISLYEQSKTLR